MVEDKIDALFQTAHYSGHIS